MFSCVDKMNQKRYSPQLSTLILTLFQNMRDLSAPTKALAQHCSYVLVMLGAFSATEFLCKYCGNLLHCEQMKHICIGRFL